MTQSARQGAVAVLELLATGVLLVAAIAVVLAVVRPGGQRLPGGRNEARVPSESIEIGARIQGSARAPIIIVEFSDFECPYCGKFARNTLPEIVGGYVDEGVVAVSYRHFPLEAIHPRSVRAAIASECAAAQGRFWEMHDQLFASLGALDQPGLRRAAVAIGLDVQAFDGCERSGNRGPIDFDLAEGRRLGISGTPEFLIGFRLEGGRVKPVKRLSGGLPEMFKRAIEEMLAAMSAG